jgi:phage-related minor tail protein
MPLTGTQATAGAAVAAAIAGLSEAEKQDVAKVWETIFSALFPHLTANTLVTTSGSPTNHTGTIS